MQEAVPQGKGSMAALISSDFSELNNLLNLGKQIGVCEIANHNSSEQVVISGHEKAIENGLDLLQLGGTAVMLGIPSDKISIDLAQSVIFKGITMKGIVGREMFKTWFEVESFMLKNPDAVEKIVSHILPFESYEEGFKLMQQGLCAKVILKLEEDA